MKRRQIKRRQIKRRRRAAKAGEGRREVSSRRSKCPPFCCELTAIDGLVRYRFGDNPALMEGWSSARDVLGPFRSKVQQEPESPAGGSQTPKAA